MRKGIEVVAAIIRSGGKIFATERGHGEFKGYWEFPGGKVEPGETHPEALKREIEEELATVVSVDDYLCTIDHDYPQFHLTLHCYLCSVLAGDLELREHEASRWLDAAQLHDVQWLPADLQLLPSLERLLGTPASPGPGIPPSGFPSSR